jgi:hypothetical protein
LELTFFCFNGTVFQKVMERCVEPKSKDLPKTKDVLRQLQAEVRQLQSVVSGMQGDDPVREPTAEKIGKMDWAVQYAVQQNPVGTARPEMHTFTEARLARVTDEAAAVLGSAISSPQKVALLRALMASSSGESAAALGAATGLSTGSLYHHLHDLMHAALIGQRARNRYVLTERGRCVLLVLLALAA